MQPFGGPGEMKFLSQNSKAPKVSQLHRLSPNRMMRSWLPYDRNWIVIFHYHWFNDPAR